MINKNIILHLAVILFFYLIIRIPILDKPLKYDEVYNTNLYLHLSEGHDYGWGTDWKRQIAFHPPGVSAFYYFWIRAFGDSEVSLHIPPLAAGFIGVILIYFLGLLVFSSRVSFYTALAITFSFSNIEYSTQAVHAIFELYIIVISLLCLALLVNTGNRKLFPLILACNLLGVVVFYHYFIYLFIQTALFWFYRKKLEVPLYYFISAVPVFILFTGFVTQGFCSGAYGFQEYWMKSNLSTIVKTIALLPYHIIL